MESIVLSTSILLQFAAAALALGQIRLTGHKIAWGCIALALFLMGVRRSIVWHQSDWSSPAGVPVSAAELVALFISALMVTGVALIGRMLRETDAAKQRLDEQVALGRSAQEKLEHNFAVSNLLNKIAIAANQSNTPERVILTTLADVCSYMDWPVGHAYLVDPDDDGRLLPSDLWHMVERERFRTFEELTAQTSFAAGEGLPGRILRSRQPAWIVDLNKDPNFPRTEMAKDIGLRSGFGLPILVGDRVRGVLEFFSEKHEEPDRYLFNVLLQIGTQIGRVFERFEADVALQESRERYRAISMSSSIAVIAADQAGAIVSWNPAAEKTFGYLAAEILGRPLTVIMPERFRAAHVDGLKRAVHSADYRILGKSVEIFGLGKNGAEFPIQLSLGTWRQSGAVFFSAVIHDISSRKTAEALLLETKERAEKASRAKSEFLASMSHELRTPLNAVLGFAQMLQLGPEATLTPGQRDQVDSIIEAGNHLLQLVNDILDLARIESDQINLVLEEVNANETVANSVALAAPLGEPRAIALIDRFGGAAPVFLRTDKLRFRQALLNLLSNAVKYNRDGGTVTVEGRQTGNGFLRVSVRDTGIGIPGESRRDVFQMFHRLGGDPMLAREGAGIGLAVTKRLVERMAGQIGFDSEEGVGSTFWIELPLASNENALIWTEALRVGIDGLDKDHQVLVTLLNRVMQQDDGDGIMDEYVLHLIDYIRYHFRREEKVMEVIEYPETARHRELHQALYTQVGRLADAWRVEHDPAILRRIKSLLWEFLFDDIIRIDTDMSRFASGKESLIADALENLD